MMDREREILDRGPVWKAHRLRILICVLLPAWLAGCGPMLTPAPAGPALTPAPVELAATPEPSAVPPPTAACGARVVDLVETESEVEVVHTSTIPARNCQLSSIVAVSTTLRMDTTQHVQLGGSVSAAVAPVAMDALEAAYDVTHGEQTEETARFMMEAEPGTYLEYPVAWKQLRARGYVVVETEGGQSIQVPYELNHALYAELGDPMDVGCD